MQPERVGTLRREHGRHTRLVVNLDEERTPSLLHKFRLGSPLLHFHAALGIDVETCETIWVEKFLDLVNLLRSAQRRDNASGKRFAQHVERLHNPLHLCGQWLQFHARDDWKFFGRHDRGKKA